MHGVRSLDAMGYGVTGCGCKGKPEWAACPYRVRGRWRREVRPLWPSRVPVEGRSGDADADAAAAAAPEEPDDEQRDRGVH